MRKILIVAITLDGKIAKYTDHNADWTSKEDKAFFHSEVKKAGAVIFGSKTYEVMGRHMPNKLNIVMTPEPQKYQDKVQKDILEFTSDAPEVAMDKLSQRGYDSVVIAGGSTIYSLFLQNGLVDELYITIAPKIFGKGLYLFKEMDIDDIDLELLEVEKLSDNGEILVKYKVIKN